VNPDWTRRRGGPRRGTAVSALRVGLALMVGLCAASAAAQETLTCGVPLLRTLAPGSTDTYRVSAAPGAAVIIQASTVSPGLGPVSLQLSGSGGVSISTLPVSPRSSAHRASSRCASQGLGGTTGGEYIFALSVVSGDDRIADSRLRTRRRHRVLGPALSMGIRFPSNKVNWPSSRPTIRCRLASSGLYPACGSTTPTERGEPPADVGTLRRHDEFHPATSETKSSSVRACRRRRSSPTGSNPSSRAVQWA
jgi:hypothetical protein